MIRKETHAAFDRLARAIDAARRIVLTTHINPDGDGLGSQVALREMLIAKGKDVSVLNHHGVPPSYRFLDPEAVILKQFIPAGDAERVLAADLIIVVDTNHPGRLGDMSGPVTESPAVKAIIDHHLEPDPFAGVVVADDASCATGELVYRFLEHVGALPLSRTSAHALYTAIMTDTGSFRFPKTDGDVHRIIATLVDSGADPVSSYESIYETGPASRLKLLGRALSSMELHAGGAVCILAITNRMFAETNTTEIDTDKIVTYAMTIGGVRTGILITELGDELKLNIRTKGSIPANEIAKAFGGNGHLNAAGARLGKASLEEIRPKVLAVTTSLLNKD